MSKVGGCVQLESPQNYTNLRVCTHEPACTCMHSKQPEGSMCEGGAVQPLHKTEEQRLIEFPFIWNETVGPAKPVCEGNSI